MRLILAIVMVTSALAEEGKWTPAQLLRFPAPELRRMGLHVPASKLWDARRGTGLLSAAISTVGCSGGLVSPDGLFVTNHHCLFSIVEEHSSPGRDLITNGFIARSREEELKGRASRLRVMRRFTDVTEAVRAAAPADAGDLARTKAIEAKQKQLVAECEKNAETRCLVAVFEGGLQYVLVEALEFTDVRLVYAPPRAIGEFGGEDDNYRWPRHTGDFAIGRVYRDGKPYKPETFFPMSRQGLKDGDFVMVLGYPGITFRSMTAAEMDYVRERFALSIDVLGELIRRVEETSKGSAEGTIAMAPAVKRYANLHTRARGQVAGLRRSGTLESRAKADDAVMQWAAGKLDYTKSAEAKRELDRLVAERRATLARDYLLGLKPPTALSHALTLVRLATERAKPESERLAEYLPRNVPTLRNQFVREQKSFFRPSDEAMFSCWAERVRALQGRERVAAMDRMPAVRELYEQTKVTDAGEAQKMFEESVQQLRARRDPLLEFAFALDVDLRAMEDEERRYNGALARLRPEWRKAVIAQAGRPVAPDANGTLRVSLAHVQGMVPQDGMVYRPFTTLAGMLEKHTGQEPFAMPPFLLEKARAVDAAKVPLNFLADGDTSGGSSGSPVLNGRGELVGLNFDRPWESVAGDFGFSGPYSRNINVDIRFLLWLLEVQGADAILRELGGPVRF
ncbi:MAG: S46 family peptidase [Bryobacterales bacterium]|nr:S46 family peptidase [Bryobacterales bacterium]